MIDEDIITSAKKIILKINKKEENDALNSRPENVSECWSKIDSLINIIQEQDKKLRSVEEKLDRLIATK